MTHLPDGTLLQGGKYKIVRFIRSGGFGCTYKAEHVMLRKQVAIKEFFVETFCERDEATAHVTVSTSKRGLVDKLRRKFIDEASAISHMEQSNIVKVTDVFEENGTAYYVMDFINGMALDEIVKNEGALPEKRALRYICQVASALKYVHDLNRLHLDVKPSNIMIDNHDRAILIDFGTSKQYDEVGGENTTTLMGKTPGYAPIEQMSNSVVKFTPATDIYALGATLYKLLTGVTPIDSTLLASGEELAPLPTSISRNVAEAIYSAMKINKTHRTQNIDTFLNTINDAGGGSGDDVEVTIIDVPHTEETSKPIIQKPIEQKPIEPTPPPTSPQGGGNKGGGPRKFPFKTIGGVLCFAVATVLIGWGISKSKGSSTASEATSTTVVAKPTEVKDAKMTYKGTTFTYTGPVNAEGNADGKGAGIYSSGTYEGNYVNGSREGEGTFVRKDGKFDGKFKNNEYNEGTFTYSDDGMYFKGTFKNGQPYDGKWYAKGGTFIEDVKDGEEVQ